MKYTTLFLCALLAACSNTAVNPPLIDDPSGEKTPAMVVTANPLASKAGADIIRAGGSAVDAAIAIEAVLSLVEPQSSGLAGGAFMVHFDNDTKMLSVYDGRETAPESAQADRFIKADGSPLGYLDAKHSGLSTGVPGVIAMLQMAHQEHGQLPWGPQFDAAKRHARQGFAVSPRLNNLITRFGKYLPKTLEEGPTEGYKYLHDDQGQPLPVGSILKNPDYAATLNTLAENPDDFYQGQLARQIVEEVNRPPRAGAITLRDLQNYTARKRTALCFPYKDMQLCGPPPPSSWLTVAMVLGIVERSHGFSSNGASNPQNWVLFGEAQRLAYADRDRYVADPETSIVPVAGMLHPDYLSLRAGEISRDKAVPKINNGDPWSFNNTVPQAAGRDATHDVAGTSHFVVVDLEGNVVSMTASVESIFGSARMVGGMFLNNQLTDFSFQATDDQGRPVANAVAAGKRPRSSMSPTVVLDANGDFKMATGSPGGNSIIAYTAKSLIGVLDWGLSAQQAVELPNLVARGDIVRIEKQRASEKLINGLRDYGFTVKESAGENSGLSVVVKTATGELEGGVDPRREGVVETVWR